MGLFNLFKPNLDKDSDAVKNLYRSSLELTRKEEEKAQKMVGKLTDQSLLADLANNSKSSAVIEIATKVLTDQTVLANIAKSHRLEYIRKIAFERLTDQEAIADVAKNAEDNMIRYYAVQELTDQTVLAYVVKNDRDSSVRKKAAENLTDNSLIAEYALNYPKDVCYDIIKRIDDKEALLAIAQNPEVYFKERQSACAKIGHTPDGNNNCICSRCGIFEDANWNPGYGLHDFQNDTCTRCGAVRYSVKHEAYDGGRFKNNTAHPAYTEIFIQYSDGKKRCALVIK